MKSEQNSQFLEMKSPSPALKRVIAYVDGFNLYFGLKEEKWRRLYWLDIALLVKNLLKPDQILSFTNYFTSRVRGAAPGDSAGAAADREASRRRQTIFLEALATFPNLKIVEGHFLYKPLKCRNCKQVNYRFEEKMTDVNIATQLLVDAYADKFDVAFIISADSDLISPVKAVRQHFPSKRIVIVFPPKRDSRALANVSNACLRIGRRTLLKSLLPLVVSLPDGRTVQCPPEWR